MTAYKVEYKDYGFWASVTIKAESAEAAQARLKAMLPMAIIGEATQEAA